MAFEREAIAPDRGNSPQHPVWIAFGILQFQFVDHLVHVDDRLIHTRDQQFGDQRDRGTRVGGAIADIDARHDFARRLERRTAQGHQAMAVAPQLHRDHVLRLGTRIEVDAAQGRHQRLSVAKGARTGSVGCQKFGRRLRNAELCFQPALHARRIAANVYPHHFFGSRRSPALDLVPRDRPACTFAVQYTSEKQGAIAGGFVRRIARFLHQPPLPQFRVAVTAPPASLPLHHPGPISPPCQLSDPGARSSAARAARSWSARFPSAGTRRSASRP